VRRSLVFEVVSLRPDLILTVRAMEMNRVCAISVVDEPHHRLSILAHHESWAWCHAIIANELSLAQVGVDLQSD